MSATTTDSYANFAASLGQGTANLQAQGGYQFQYLSRNHIELEAMYRGSWLVGQVVDCVAEDMTREALEITSDVDPEATDLLRAALDELCVLDRLCDALKWARLFGGAIAVHLIDGQDLSTPLRPETVGRDQYRGLMVLDRWMIQPTLNETVTELGPDYGMPLAYITYPGNQSAPVPTQRVHHTRCIRLDGVDLPYWQRLAENGWGMSVIERLYDRMVAFDSTTTGAGQLAFKAHLRTYAVEGLREIVAAGMSSPQMSGLVSQIAMMRLTQSNEGVTLVDTKDRFETHQYAFAGLSDLLGQFGEQLSGATQIPLVRLFGQSPAGLNSTGESDLRTYYDGIKRQQNRRLRGPLRVLLDLLSRSKLGRPLPDDFALGFRSLWQMDAGQKADLSAKVTDNILKVREAGLVSDRTALRELKQQAPETGVWTNITTEDIEAAESEPPPPPPPPAPGSPEALAQIEAESRAGAAADPGEAKPSVDPGERPSSDAALPPPLRADRQWRWAA